MESLKRLIKFMFPPKQERVFLDWEMELLLTHDYMGHDGDNLIHYWKRKDDGWIEEIII